MEKLLNNDDQQQDAQDENAAPNEARERVLPHLAPPANSVGLHMLSLSAATPRSTPPRLPPISLLTAAAAALQPMQSHHHPNLVQQPPQPQLRPMVTASSATTTSRPTIARHEGDDMLCRYRNKKCGYPRAIKRNGDRHNLCERHRAKANQNQRKLESKRRNQKRMLARVMAAQSDNKAESEIKFSLYGEQSV